MADISPSSGRLTALTNSWGDTQDIISAILQADRGDAAHEIPPAENYVRDFVLSIRGATVEDSCRAIYDFVTTHIDYVDDNDKPAWIWLMANKPGTPATDRAAIDWVKRNVSGIGYSVNAQGEIELDPHMDWQVVQQPGELWANRKREYGGTGLGGDCKSMSIFSAACIRALYGDIYCYRLISQEADKDYHHVYAVVDKNIILDCVEDRFNKEVPHVKQKDMYPRGSNVSKVGATAFPLKATVAPGYLTDQAAMNLQATLVGPDTTSVVVTPGNPPAATGMSTTSLVVGGLALLALIALFSD